MPQPQDVQKIIGIMLILLMFFICLLFNSTTQSLIFQYFTAEVFGYRSSTDLEILSRSPAHGQRSKFFS